MAQKISTLLPIADKLLQQFGERLRLARLRRGLSAKQVCERAGMAPMTLRSVERGGSGVTIGAYMAVMQVLGIEQDLSLLGQVDAVGRSLQDSRLPAPRVASVHSRTFLGENREVTLGPDYEEMKRLAAGESALDQMHKVMGPDYKEMKRLASGESALDQMRKAMGPDYEEMKRLASGDSALDKSRKFQETSVANKDHTNWANEGKFISSSALSNLIALPKKDK
ncbi:helix-turn-helix domain-containing protein [Undibacterium sp. Ji42W]|uniref:helix-turn-helix domain-containing protein n=1 Tax=Undibacterium sp. Ji42W TaxID=3413039 RepID=UPI003BF075D8